MRSLACALLGWAAILAWPLSATAAPRAPVALAKDFTADAAQAQKQGVPLVVMFSRADCAWCKQVRRQHLEFLVAQMPPTALVREVAIDDERLLNDFAGRRTSHRQFAATHGVRLAPTLMFFGYAGESVAERMVGVGLADYYGAYLEQAIGEGRRRVRGEP